MFPAKVYRIMIGCPGDVREEVQIAKNVINRWTILHSEQRGIVLLPINWEDDSYPEHGAHPQKILNKQLANKSDMLIGIFGAKVGTPTDTSQSGTIEEIEEHIKAAKPIMLFFRKYNDTTNVTADELSQLKVFKSRIQKLNYFKEYNRTDDFENIFSESLNLFMNNNWKNESPSITSDNDDVKFSDEEIDILRKWVGSNNNTAQSYLFKGGIDYRVGDLSYEVPGGRESARWNDFFNRLYQVGFVDLNGYSNQGTPIYQLRLAAYDFIESLDLN